MALQIKGPLSCITHQTLSYIGSPTIETALPGGDAVPLFEGLDKAEEFRSKMKESDRYECEEFGTLDEFIFFLKCINREGIQYGIINPIYGKEVPNSILHIGRILAQMPGGESFASDH